MKLNDIALSCLTIAIVLVGLNGVFGYQPSSFAKRSVQVGNEVFGYRIYIPRNLKKKPPVMLYLHNNGANGSDNERQIQGIDKVIASRPDLFDFIIVFPQARSNTFWLGIQTEQAIKALDTTVIEFGGDTKRLYLSGHSLGGYGTWTTAVQYQRKFAALVPIAGGIIPPFKLPPAASLIIPKEILSILAAANPYQALASSIGNTPVWVFHGAQDKSISVNESINIVAALKKNRSKNVLFTKYPDTDHNDVLFKALTDVKLYKWLGKQKRSQ